MTHQNQTESNESLPFLVWDTCDIALQQAKFLVDTGEAENEDEGFRIACEDRDLLDFEWESLTDCLTETLQAINPEGYWHAEVEHFGWRNQNGFTDFEADDGQTFLAKVLPKTDCSFKVFLARDTLRIQNFHHDSPTGEWYAVRPDTESDDEFNDDYDEYD